MLYPSQNFPQVGAADTGHQRLSRHREDGEVSQSQFAHVDVLAVAGPWPCHLLHQLLDPGFSNAVVLGLRVMHNDGRRGLLWNKLESR
jgi:hypothetical protein